MWDEVPRLSLDVGLIQFPEPYPTVERIPKTHPQAYQQKR